MQDILFYIFGGLAVVCAFLVVANPFSRNPVTSAMFLVLTIVFLAGLFVLLEAFFLAAVQILVYAGAVIVLFLFVIMLLNVRDEERRRIKKVMLALGTIVVGSLGFVFVLAIWGSHLSDNLPPPTLRGETIPLGKALFTQYLLPFEIVSILLLVAMIGVILLSKKEIR